MAIHTKGVRCPFDVGLADPLQRVTTLRPTLRHAERGAGQLFHLALLVEVANQQLLVLHVLHSVSGVDQLVQTGLVEGAMLRLPQVRLLGQHPANKQNYSFT